MHDKENVLSKRLNKVLQARHENDEDTLEALKELSTFYGENSIQARRNLRSQIEKRSLEINENFLFSLKEVKDTFENVYQDIVEMSHFVEDMTSKLKNAKSQTKQLLEKTKTLEEESALNEMKQKTSAAFLETLQLSHDELLILHGSKLKPEAHISEELFSVLDKVHKIHSDCKILIQAGHEQLAINTMEQMTLHQERALERLYRWTLDYCRSIDNPELTDLVAKSIARIQDRPLLFQNILSEYCSSRRGVLAGEFIDALTRGGPSGNPAPIELRAHDPQIYITDILVWLNKNIPNEKRNLNLLLKECKREGLIEVLEEALGSICEGICQPLNIRIEKILNVPVEPSILYGLTNLIRYYKKSIGKIVTKGLLVSTLEELQNKSEKNFLLSLENQVRNVLVRVEAPPRDLSPTSSIHQLISILRDMLSTASMSEGREVDMIRIAQAVVEPLLRAVNEQASRLPPTDMAVYTLNCMYSLYTCLSLYEFMDDKLERIQAQSDAQLDTLTSEQASNLVANMNLGPIYTILQDQSHGPLSTVIGMEPSNLTNFLIKLDAVIAAPDTALLPQVHLLISSNHKKAVQKRSFEVLLAIYKNLYESVHNPSNLYENPEGILHKTPEEVAKILSFS